MDHNNLSFKAILMKYRCPFVPSLFQKRPSCFPKRCLLLDSQRVNENARVIRRSLPMSLFGPCPTSSAQKLSILSSAHRAHDSAHTNVFDLENQSECELLIKILASLQCSKRCQFNNCFAFFCHGEQNNSHETFA